MILISRRNCWWTTKSFI